MAKRRRKKIGQPAKKNLLQGSTDQPKREQPARRELVYQVRNWGLLFAAITAAGWYPVSEMPATAFPLLFDGQGQRRRILSGSNNSDILKHYSRNLRNRYRAAH